MSRYVVIGGGVSGLAAARLLAGAIPVSDSDAGGSPTGAHSARGTVVLLEASERLGGKILTGTFSGTRVELGPDQFLRRDPSAERLCRHLGLGDDLVEPSAGSAAVFAGGRPRQLPAGLVLGIPTDLDALARSGIVGQEAVDFAGGDAERPGAVLEAADVGLETPGRNDDDPARERSAGAILRARLGDEIVDRLVDPLIGGINAGSIDNLSLGTVAPQIARLLVGHRDVLAPLAASMPVAAARTQPAQATGTSSEPVGERRISPFFGVAGGLGRVVSGLQTELGQLGCEVRLECPALRIRTAQDGGTYVVETRGGEIAADGIVVALPAQAAARLLEAVAPEVTAHLRTISYGSVAVVTFALDRALPATLEGWSGVLVPRAEGTVMTALTLLSQKWPWMSTGTAEGPLVRVSAGRYLDRRIDALNDEELCRALAGELAHVTGATISVSDTLVRRWNEAFPQYAPGHGPRMRAVERLLGQRPGLALAGATLGGIGLPACITSGERAAEVVSASVTAAA